MRSAESARSEINSSSAVICMHERLSCHRLMSACSNVQTIPQKSRVTAQVSLINAVSCCRQMGKVSTVASEEDYILHFPHHISCTAL